jgi:threonylcarbamoyladenosine tRNA methylthiotransferase MtaB
MSTKTVAFHSFGCKLNQSETQSLEKGFVDRGYQVVPFNSKADYYVVDTCTVTDQADSKCRNIIRKAERQNSDGRVIVTGCMAQMDAERIKEINPKSLVIGTFEKFNMFNILEDVESSNDWENALFIDKSKTFTGSKSTEFSSRTRAFLKIQDGCNYVCSFCIIPYARGRDRSNKLDAAINDARDLVKDGYKEIVLTGVNIGEYKDEAYRIDDLVEAISEIDGLERLRVSSIEPNTVTDRLISLISERKNIMPHFHVPIQSGSSHILEKMRRHYDSDAIRRILDRICSSIPNLALGSDFIIGFPKETDADFNETVKLIEEYPFTYFHTFTFSSRQNTIAARMPDHIDQKTKFSRSEYLRKLNEHKKLIYAEKNIGSIHDVLLEGKIENGLINGYTDNYIKVSLAADEALKNTIVKVKLERIENHKVLAKLI